MQKKNTLAKGILLIFIANIINMGFNVLTNLFLPKYLTIDSYASIKTYQLYVSYVGILHFGFSDGMYLKYGGKEIHAIGGEGLEINLSTMKVFQTAVALMSLFFAFAFRNRLLIFVSLTVLPHNMITYYNSLFQASGEFKAYGRIMNGMSIGMFCINFFILFILQIDAYEWYVIGYTLLYFVIWGLLEFYTRNRLQIHTRLSGFSFQELISGIQSGILLMLGNFSSMFITSLDRWFVKFLLETIHFAQYSFAVSMESFLNIAVTPVSTTLYNYFCISCTHERVRQMRERMVLFGCTLVSAVFPVRFLLRIYLQKYLDAQTVLILLFASQMFYIVNKSVFTNLYKAKKMQSKYFLRLFTAIVIAFVFNILGYLIAHQKEMFAIGTFLSAVVWLLIVSNDFRKDGYACTRREMCFLLGASALFILINLLLHPVPGFFLYLLSISGLGFLLMRDSIRGFIVDIRDLVLTRLDAQ